MPILGVTAAAKQKGGMYHVQAVKKRATSRFWLRNCLTCVFSVQSSPRSSLRGRILVCIGLSRQLHDISGGPNCRNRAVLAALGCLFELQAFARIPGTSAARFQSSSIKLGDVQNGLYVLGYVGQLRLRQDFRLGG